MLHVLELVIILAVVYGIDQLFTIDSQLVNGVIVAVFAGLTKFARVHDGSPLPDYVNE